MSAAKQEHLKDYQEKYQVYLEERKSLIDAHREGGRSFDKSMLTLSAGAFGISLAFIKQIAPTLQAGSVVILIWSWVLFGGALLCTLVSFLTSQSAFLRQIEILEEEIDKSDDSSNESNSRNIYDTITRVLNYVSVLLFIAGTSLLAYFSATNLLALEG